MKLAIRKSISKNLLKFTLGGLLATVLFFNQSVLAAPDYIFFSINGDTTLTTMTQGDELSWGANCDSGATINWVIWYDANSNSTIDPSTDILLMSENITDGNPVTELDPILDGWSIGEVFKASLEPGNYIFKATDIDTDASVQKILSMSAMASPPNQLTGQIFLPGITSPSSLLANRIVFAETDTGDEGAFAGVTNNMGQYSINIGAVGTGLEFYLEASNVPNFVTPDYISVTASGVITGNDFTYISPADSVWGFVKDETGTALQFETSVSAQSGSLNKYVTTSSSRYVIYFSSSDKSDWSLDSDSRNSPAYLSQDRFYFSHDTLSSFQHDIILTKTNAMIYAKITENGGLPANRYRVDASSATLSSWAESVTGIGSDNIVGIGVSTLDNSGWWVNIATYDEDYPLPAGLIPNPSSMSSVSPGDTVSFNLISGHLISGALTQDPEDGPIIWDNVYIGVEGYGANAGAGAYSFYSDTGSYTLGAFADGYITDPTWRNITVTGDITSGLGFTINEAHCRVSGTLNNLPLPLNASYYTVSARTGTSGADGYFVNAQIDSTTGTYTFDLCDGDWTFDVPYFDGYTSPTALALTVGEAPDIVKTFDLDYTADRPCGDANADGNVNLGDAIYLINFIFRAGSPPSPLCTGKANGDEAVNMGDAVYLINFIFREGSAPYLNCCP